MVAAKVPPLRAELNKMEVLRLPPARDKSIFNVNLPRRHRRPDRTVEPCKTLFPLPNFINHVNYI